MYGHRDIPRNLDRFTVIETLKLRELLRITFDEIGQLVDEPGPLEACDVLAPSGLKSLASGGDRDVDVLLGRYRTADEKKN